MKQLLINYTEINLKTTLLPKPVIPSDSEESPSRSIP